MINGKLKEFVGAVIAKGQIRYGDVRRLQRDCLPDGITNREELEFVISINARLVRADKAWEQWFVAAVAAFVAIAETGEHPVEEAAGECVGRLLAASATRLGRRIGRQVRRELERRQGIRSTADKPHAEGVMSCDRERPSVDGASNNDRNDRAPRSAKRRCAVRRKAVQGAVPLAGGAPSWCLAGYLPAVQRSHFMNFPSARACLVLAPCR